LNVENARSSIGNGKEVNLIFFDFHTTPSKKFDCYGKIEIPASEAFGD
jgi:hypothetical protein